MKPSVSIALATYNGEPYLYEQLVSLSDQSILPDELVIVDDSSDDLTCQIIEKFSETAPFPVRLFKNIENLGYTPTFCKAMMACDGDFVFLCDQDDVWHKNKIEVMLNAFSTNTQKQLLIHDLEFCNSQLEPIGQTKLERLASFSDPESSYVTGMATVIRKRFLQTLLPMPDEKNFSFDAWLHCCAGAVGVKGVVDSVLADYRRHDSNATLGVRINSSKKTSALDFYKESAQSDTLSWLGLNRFKNKVIMRWIAENREPLSAVVGEEKTFFQAAEKLLEIRNENYETRIHNLSLRRLSRLIPILIHYSKGGYSEYNGVKSLLKDLFLN